MRLLIGLLAGILFISCQSGVNTTLEDVTDLNSAFERWNSLNMRSYEFELTRACECLPPAEYTVMVSRGRVNDVRFEEMTQNGHETVEQLKNNTLTVDQLFEVIKSYANSAHHFEVEFHAKLGYPTRVFIDPSAEIADDEIILRISNLVPR